jgi:hypothetical protein
MVCNNRHVVEHCTTECGYLLPGVLPYLNDVVGQQAVRLAVNGDGRLLAGCLNQTMEFTVGLVEPVVQVLDAVFRLGFQVGVMRLSDGMFAQAFRVFVYVYEQWHGYLLDGLQP